SFPGGSKVGSVRKRSPKISIKAVGPPMYVMRGLVSIGSPFGPLSQENAGTREPARIRIAGSRFGNDASERDFRTRSVTYFFFTISASIWIFTLSPITASPVLRRLL